MQVKGLIAGLKGPDPLRVLKEFNNYMKNSEEKDDFIQRFFITANCDVILNLLRIEQVRYGSLKSVYESLGHILNNLTKSINEHQKIALNISRHVLESNGDRLYKMLEDERTDRIKAGLFCLTGLVMAGGEVANAALNFLDPRQKCFKSILGSRHFMEEHDVRSYYINLLLMFLKSDDPYLVNRFLDRTGLLQSVFPGLKADKSSQVLSILKAMYEHILLNSSVRKMAKVHMFTPTSTSYLIDLYTWKNPERKKSKKIQLQEEAEIVNEVQKFFTTLLTSTDKGILFKINARTRDSNPNWYVYKIISNIKKPWDTFACKETLTIVFAACPDLLLIYLESIENLLVPRSSESFISLMVLLVDIMRCQKPWQFAKSRGWETVVSCLFPGPPLTSDFYLGLIQSEHEAVRHVGFTLMLTILKKLKETLDNLKKSNLPSEFFEKIQQELIKSASSIFSPQVLEIATQTWKSIANEIRKGQKTMERLDSKDPMSVPAAVEILNILKFLSCYNDLSPSSIIEEILNPVSLLETVQCLNFIKVSKEKRIFVAREEFWMICQELLAKSISNRKFSVNTSVIEENVFYLLIITYAHYQRKNEFSANFSTYDVRCSLIDILSCALAKAGVAVDAEGSIRYWLRHVCGAKYVKLSTFLTHVIQQTVSSYNQHTDYMIELGEKYTQTNDISLIDNLENLDVANSQHFSTSTVFKPFSRFVLAGVDLLSNNPDPVCKAYFSKVVNDYLHTLDNPRALASFLLSKQAFIDNDLKEYLGCFFSHPELVEGNTRELSSNLDFTGLLKYLFMTHNWSSVADKLKAPNLAELIKTDPQEKVLQILLYLRLELEEQNPRSSLLIEKYSELLKDMYLIFENDDKANAQMMVKTVLEHPQILLSFSPFTTSKCPVDDLCHFFIKAAFENSEVIACTYPFYKKIMNEVKSLSVEQDSSFDCWEAVSPFVMSENTIISYNDLEELLIIYLKMPFALTSPHGTFLHRLLTLLFRTTSAKRHPKEVTVQLLLNKYLEWNTSDEERRPEIVSNILTTLGTLLPQIITKKTIEQFSHDDLKRLLQYRPPCADLCCQIVKFNRQHGLYLASKMKKYGGDISLHTQLLSTLLSHEESLKGAQEILKELQEVVKDRATEMKADDESYHDLLVHAVNADIMDKGDLADICAHVYERIVKEKHVPPNDITYFSVLFQKTTEDELLKAKLPHGDGNLLLLHILLSLIRSVYKKDASNTVLLFNCCQMLKEVTPKIDGSLLQSNLLSSKIWPSFVKQVLRVGLNDPVNGPSLIHILDLVIDGMYKNGIRNKSLENDSPLTISTIYHMIISHTQYVELMFKREAEWDKLKESLVAVQQTIVNYEESVCLEAHVPIFLGAYGASMSAADQRILKLLYTYENKGFMKRYQPVLWGDTAVSHFGMLSSSEDRFKEPKLEQILAILDKDKIYKTCHSFNYHLSLEPQEICGDDRTIYDIRFLIPLLLYIAEEKELLEIDFAECGAVALGFSCLSSYQEQVWGAGATILKRVVDKMNNSRHQRLKLPWVWAITIVSGSLCGERRRLSSVIVQYLICVSSLLSTPQDPMYFPILRALFVRPSLDIKRVPQFSRLYVSGDIFDSRIHLSFLLRFLAYGIRQHEDYFICERTSTATMITSLLQSPTADSEIRVQALKVLESMVGLPLAAHELVNKHNVLTLLPIAISSAVSSIHGSNFKRNVTYSGKSLLIESVLRVLAAIWSSMFAVTKKTKLLNRNRYDHSYKRKMQDSDSDEETDEEDAHVKDCNNASKKFKSSDDTIGLHKKQTDVAVTEMDAPNGKPQLKVLRPLFVEEYLNCLLHLVPLVIENAPSELVARHLTLIADTVDHVTSFSKTSEKETLRNIAMDPHIVKERVVNHINWNFLHKSLKTYLTDKEEVRLLGKDAEHLLDEWKEQCLAEHHHIRSPNSSCKTDNLNKLKISVLNLLDVLGR